MHITVTTHEEHEYVFRVSEDERIKIHDVINYAISMLKYREGSNNNEVGQLLAALQAAFANTAEKPQNQDPQ